VILLLK